MDESNPRGRTQGRVTDILAVGGLALIGAFDLQMVGNHPDSI
jgi:hypothetical protein